MGDTIDTHDADSGRTDSDKQAADVLATSGPSENPDVFLVEYPDGEVRYEPATPRNQALFGEGMYSEIAGVTQYTTESGSTIVLEADIEAGEYRLSHVYSFDQDMWFARVPEDFVDEVIEAATGPQPAARLLDLYEQITAGMVRRNVVTQFSERFPSERIAITDDGWEIDETFVVTYEATNHLLTVDPVSPSGGSFDDTKQAVYLDVNAEDTREVVTPEATQVTLEPVEQEFLAQVEALLFPDQYFGVELVDEIEAHKTDRVGDVVEDLTDQATVSGFTDSKTGIHHGSSNHSFTKHRITDLGVTDEVSNLLWAHDYDHAGVVELAMRKNELIERPDVAVFADAPDGDPGKWDKIERTKENAPIPNDVHRKLEDMYK